MRATQITGQMGRYYGLAIRSCGVWSAARAHTLFKEITASFEAPPMEASINDALQDFVARRKSEGGAPTGF